jgi:hypothetical protein
MRNMEEEHTDDERQRGKLSAAIARAKAPAAFGDHLCERNRAMGGCVGG